MVTPSFVIVGAPNFLSRTTFLPLGPRVTRTVFASLSTPRWSASRAAESNCSCLAMDFHSSLPRPPGFVSRGARQPYVGTILNRVLIEETLPDAAHERNPPSAPSMNARYSLCFLGLARDRGPRRGGGLGRLGAFASGFSGLS